MAKYNREFLIPYLTDLCALHLAKADLKKKVRSAASEEIRLRNNIECLRKPIPKQTESYGMETFGLITGGICLIVSFMDILIISFLAGVFATFLLICYTFLLFSKINKNAEITNENQRALSEYNRQLSKSEDEYNRQLPELVKKDKLYSAELKKVDKTLKQLYDANVIPGRYRDLYAAVYLYDWFSTSRADDLDMALNMFALEEIKDKLDVIIDQQSRILLNQRKIIANQNYSIQLQEKQRKEMVSKLKKLQLTAEEQTQYLQMIEGNTAATAYFAASDYIKNL